MIGISFFSTVTVHSAVFPFELVAVIITVPAFFASTCPVVSTVAMSLLLLLQLISFLSVVFSGRTVAVSVVDSPSVSVALLLSIRTSVIGISFFSTVIAQLAVFPFSLVAVITAVPALLAVIVPSSDTVATASLLLLQLTLLLSVVFSGRTVAVSLCVFPSIIPTALSLRLTSVIGISFFSTVTVQLAVFPFVLVAVITAVPTLFAVTVPSSDTVATASLLLLQLMSLLSVVLTGRTVAVSLKVSPSYISSASLPSCTSVIGTSTGCSGLSADFTS